MYGFHGTRHIFFRVVSLRGSCFICFVAVCSIKSSHPNLNSRKTRSPVGTLVLPVLTLNDYASSTVGTSSVLQEKIKYSGTRNDEWKSYVFLPALSTTKKPHSYIHTFQLELELHFLPQHRRENGNVQHTAPQNTPTWRNSAYVW